MKDSITLTDPKVLTCPYGAYQTLRDDAPVYKDPVTGFFVVTRYEDIRNIARDTNLFSNYTTQLFGGDDPVNDECNRLYEEAGYRRVNTLSTDDPPRHSIHRVLVDKAFRVNRVHQMQAYIDEIARELVATLLDKNQVEFVTEVCVPMPVAIIADQLGVSRDGIADFKRWSDSVVTSSDPLASREARISAAHDIIEMYRFLEEKVLFFRANPANNIISDLACARDGEGYFSMDELLSILLALLAAGNETTTASMNMGMKILIEQGLEHQLRDDLSLVPNFVEEILRLDAPVQGLFRRATEDTEMHGVHIPQDSIIVLRWGAGNRDERRFANPDALDLHRSGGSQHLTFGYGIHYCIGNALARAELRAIFTELLSKLKHFALVNEPEIVVHTFTRGYRRLDITYERC